MGKNTKAVTRRKDSRGLAGLAGTGPPADWRAARDAEAAVRIPPRAKGRTKNQDAYLASMASSTVTICTGPAGTGKTFLACGFGLGLLREGAVKRIIVSRPLVECDEELGFLPGDANEKMGPYVAPLMAALGEFATTKDVERMLDDGRLVLLPLAVMRGWTFKDAFTILDEGQNATARQLKMFLTRIGEGSRVVVCGDTRQSDLPGRRSPLEGVARKLKGNPQIGIIGLGPEDIQRHQLVRWIDEKLGDG